MPDDPAFIRAIAAAPADDAPRLVYADVLDERGDEASTARAEFIRVQIERASLEPRSPRWNALWYRDTALLDWARRWREELPTIPGVAYGGYIRGFIDRVELWTADALPAGMDAVFDAIPVRRIDLMTPEPGDVAAVLGWPGLERVCELGFRGVPITAPLLDRLIDRGPWANLVRLDVLDPTRLPQAVANNRPLMRRLQERFKDRLA